MVETVSQSMDYYVHLEQMIAELRNTISQQREVITSFQQKHASSQKNQVTTESAIQKLAKFKKFATSSFK